MTPPTQDFLVVMAGIALAVFGVTSAYELIKRVFQSEEEIIVLRSNIIFAALVIAASMMPLMCDEYAYCINVSSGLFSMLSATLYSFIVSDIRAGRTRIRFRKASIPFLVAVPPLILLLAVNAGALGSFVLYKVVLFIAVLLLLYRFSLSIGNLVVTDAAAQRDSKQISRKGE